MFFLKQFWSPRKAFEPCGMFTYGHFLLLLPCIAIFIGLIKKAKKIKEENIEQHINNITKFLAILLTILEGIKIFFNFYWGYTWIGAWFPISYCSIFIYALWMSGFGNERIRNYR